MIIPDTRGEVPEHDSIPEWLSALQMAYAMEFGTLTITYENGRPNRIDRHEIVKFGRDGKVAKSVRDIAQKE